MGFSSNLTVLNVSLSPDASPPEQHAPTHKAMYESVSHVHLYLVPVMVAYGLVANVSCGCILTFSKLHRLPLSVLLAVCAYSDSLFLLGLFCTWLATGPAVVYQSVQWCYFISMLTNTSHFLSTWCQVAVLAHCYIIVGTSKVVSALAVKMLAVGIAIVAVVIFANLTLLTDAQSLDGVSFCRPLAAYISIAQVLNKLDLLANSVFPFVVSLSLIALCLRILKRESYVIVNLNVAPLQDGLRPENRRKLSAAEESSRLSAAICYILSFVLVLTLPSLLLRLVHTIREVFIAPQHNVHATEIIAQSIVQYLLYITYTLKGLLLPLLWTPYRTMSWKIVRRLLNLLAGAFKCRKRGQLNTMNALWSQSARVNLISYPRVRNVTTL